MTNYISFIYREMPKFLIRYILFERTRRAISLKVKIIENKANNKMFFVIQTFFHDIFFEKKNKQQRCILMIYIMN